MPYLDAEYCGSCGETELFWWSEDETEDTMEVYVTCESCGKEYPKRFVNKSEDTSYEALLNIAKDIAS